MAYKSTKHGREIPEIPRRKFGFNFIGHDDKGVAIWRGNPSSITWGARVLTVTTTLFTCLSIGLTIARVWEGALACGLGALIHGSLSFYMRRMQKSVDKLETEQELTNDLHVDHGEVERIAEQYQVKPRMIINGRPYYSAEDFDEATRLLRAAAPPSEQSLLRPAASSPNCTEESLLRPVQPSNDSNEEQIVKLNGT